MGNKYHVLHRHLSRLSRPDDLGLEVAVPSIHPVSEKTSSQRFPETILAANPGTYSET
jgi:recombinational DNA repair protein RecR